jgi:hypothetical protein
LSLVSVFNLFLLQVKGVDLHEKVSSINKRGSVAR